MTGSMAGGSNSAVDAGIEGVALDHTELLMDLSDDGKFGAERLVNELTRFGSLLGWIFVIRF